MLRMLKTAALALVVGMATVSCGEAPMKKSATNVYAPKIDPAQFVDKVDNPFYPLTPGTRMIYEGPTEEGIERIVIEVTRDTKTVMGVKCVVVRDTVSLDGKVIEDTFDWYAQHSDGTVWYFGEDTTEYKDGKALNHNGAWEGGMDGAVPGIVMLADPKVGDSYRQEFYKGHAEDEADVVSITESETVPFGIYKDLLMTKDYTKLDTSVLEHKYYARGVGFVLEVSLKGGKERIELIKVEQF